MVLLQHPPRFSQTKTSPKLPLLVCFSSGFVSPSSEASAFSSFCFRMVWSGSKGQEAKYVDNKKELQVIFVWK